MTKSKTVEKDAETPRKYPLTRAALYSLLNIDDGNEAVAATIASMLADNSSSWMLEDEIAGDGLQWASGCIEASHHIPSGIGIELSPYKGTVSIDLLDIVQKVMSAISTMTQRNIECLLFEFDEDDDEEAEA